MGSRDDFLNEYAEWRVYLYEPKQGVLFCPHCRRAVVPFVSGSILPPFVCNSDKIFFDNCLNHELWQKRVHAGGSFKRGDMQQMYDKYLAISYLKS
jgi:hypothetical protein